MTTAQKPQPLQRDAFIDQIYDIAKKRQDVVFLCCDLGAAALDRFRAELAPQFIHTGISEQNMMDVAAGMAQCGKTVYAYAMAPFVTFRCFEQIKVSLAAMKQPVTLVGVGIGYGYDDAGPTHYATEDLTVMRSLAGIEIFTPSDDRQVQEVAKLSYSKPALRYVRLDRKFLPHLYDNRPDFKIEDGIAETVKGKKACVVASGFMVHTAMKAREALASQGIDLGVIDVFRLKPLNSAQLAQLVKPYDTLFTLEEHFLSGGFGSAILEGLSDQRVLKPVTRIGVEDHYYFDNGGRSHVHKLCGIDPESVTRKISETLRSH